MNDFLVAVASGITLACAVVFILRRLSRIASRVYGTKESPATTNQNERADVAKLYARLRELTILGAVAAFCYFIVRGEVAAHPGQNIPGVLTLVLGPILFVSYLCLPIQLLRIFFALAVTVRRRSQK